MISNKIQVETPLGTKTFKIDDIVQASQELRVVSMLGHGFKFRIIAVVNNWQVLVRVLEHNGFTEHDAWRESKSDTTRTAIVNYKKDELKKFEFKIAAQYLEQIKTKTSTSSISGFGF